MTIPRTDDLPEWVSLLPKHGSFSQLNSWGECSYKYVIEKAFRPPAKPAWWFAGGTAFHEATAKWDALRWEHGPDLYGPDALTALFFAEFDLEIAKNEVAEPDRTLWRAAGKGREDERFYRNNAPKWCAAYAEEAKRVEVFEIDNSPAVEFKFDVVLGGVEVTGYIDRILVDPHGQLTVRDLKTGSSDSNTTQLSLYAVVAKMQWGLEIARGDYWNPRKVEQQPPVDVRPHDQHHFDRLFAGFDAGRKSGNPVPSVGLHCKWCEFRRNCPAHLDNTEVYAI